MFRTETRHYMTLPNGVEVELPILPEDWLQGEVRAGQRKDGIFRVAYLVHDDYCSNPLDDCDGFGKVWHHPRSRYGKSDGYYEALGLDSYGEPVIDEDKLQQMWHDKVMALPPERFTLPEEFVGQAWEPAPVYSSKCGKVPYWITLRQWLADESVADTTLREQCRYAWRDTLTDEAIEAILEQIEDHLITWDYETAAEECQQPMSEYAYLLDVYDHSGRAYSLSGGGMQCRWDTSRGEAVWIADEYAKEEIDRRAKVYAFGEIVERGYKTKTRYAVVFDLGGSPVEFKCWHEAFDALLGHSFNFGEPTPEQLAQGHARALYEVAKQSVAQYDAWQRGECYGVVCVDYDADGKQIGEEDACWGYIGHEYAEETRDEYFTNFDQQQEAA